MSGPWPRGSSRCSPDQAPTNLRVLHSHCTDTKDFLHWQVLFPECCLSWSTAGSKLEKAELPRSGEGASHWKRWDILGHCPGIIPLPCLGLQFTTLHWWPSGLWHKEILRAIPQTLWKPGPQERGSSFFENLYSYVEVEFVFYWDCFLCVWLQSQPSLILPERIKKEGNIGGQASADCVFKQVSK